MIKFKLKMELVILTLLFTLCKREKEGALVGIGGRVRRVVRGEAPGEGDWTPRTVWISTREKLSRPLPRT